MCQERVMRISHLRDNLGWAYRQVAQTDIPIVVQRYSRKDVAIVALWEWRFFGELEAEVERLRTELAARDAVIDKLPRTADGVPIVPPMDVWISRRPVSGSNYFVKRMQAKCIDWFAGEWLVRNRNSSSLTCEEAKDCYSTRKAAEAGESDE